MLDSVKENKIFKNKSLRGENENYILLSSNNLRKKLREV